VVCGGLLDPVSSSITGGENFGIGGRGERGERSGGVQGSGDLRMSNSVPVLMSKLLGRVVEGVSGRDFMCKLPVLDRRRNVGLRLGFFGAS
jgi:hypothetical protein